MQTNSIVHFEGTHARKRDKTRNCSGGQAFQKEVSKGLWLGLEILETLTRAHWQAGGWEGQPGRDYKLKSSF